MASRSRTTAWFEGECMDTTTRAADDQRVAIVRKQAGPGQAGPGITTTTTTPLPGTQSRVCPKRHLVPSRQEKKNPTTSQIHSAVRTWPDGGDHGIRK